MSALVRISLAGVFCFMAKPTLYHIQKMQPTICILGKKWVSKNLVGIILVYSLPYIANTVLRNTTGYRGREIHHSVPVIEFLQKTPAFLQALL